MLCSISIFPEILQSVLERSAMSCRRSLPGTLRWDARGCSPGTGVGGGGWVETSLFLSALFIVFTFWVGMGKLGERVRQFFRWEERCGTWEEAPVRLDLGCIDLMGRGVGWGLHQEERVGIPGWRGFCWCSHWLAQSLVFPSAALMLCSTLTGSKTE